MKYYNNNIYRASRYLSEALDINDPMNDEDFNSTSNDDETTYDLDVANPVCPCCGARLNIVDATEDTEEDINNIEAMDPSLEPEDTKENDDVYVTIDDTDDDSDDEIEDSEDDDSENEYFDDEDEDEDSSEKVEAFDDEF